MGIFKKVIQAAESGLDTYIEKSKVTNTSKKDEDDSFYQERKSVVDFSYTEQDQHGFKEKTGLCGPGVLKNMARKDSVVTAIIQTKQAQVKPFTTLQKDRYSPGWDIIAMESADVDDEEKLKLSDPNLSDEETDQVQHEINTKIAKIKKKQNEDRKKIKDFIQNCGMPMDESDTTNKRWNFSKFVSAIVEDRYTYYYAAIELVPTRDGTKLHHFYPVCAGTIKYVSTQSAERQQQIFKDIIASRESSAIGNPNGFDKRFNKKKPFKYVQVVRGQKIAAFTEDELIFEPATPTTDPEDNGYSMGELEKLIQIITAHLYAEAHNRNFFTQGLGTKGILHIKGNNISRTQLEAFKRQWFNQVVNSRNAFRPPIIGIAEDVKWVELAQSNKDMEFDNWMNYLIKIACAVFQIDPAEINFDISKGTNSTLQEANNEEKLKASKDKGLRPLLDYIEDLVNNHILVYWDKELASKYKFKFVGFDAESRRAEQERIQKETSVWKTINEARIEMGFPPIEDGDIVGNAIYSQYKAQKLQQKQAEDAAMQGGVDGAAPMDANAEPDQQSPDGMGDELSQLEQELGTALDDQDSDKEADLKAKEKEDTKKSQPSVIEYYIGKKDE